jgi:hypothetical protein
MKKILAIIFSLAAAGAYAASSSVNYTSSCSSGIRTATDGTTNCTGSTACNLPNYTIWDYSAGANGWSISSNHGGLVEVEQGGNTAAVKAASTAAAQTDPAFVVRNPDVGTTSDSAYTGSGTASVIAALKGIYTGITSAIPAGTNVIGGFFGSPNVTPTDCSLAITTGGTAQNIISASATIHGFTIANIDTSAGSGEPVWFSFNSGGIDDRLVSPRCADRVHICESRKLYDPCRLRQQPRCLRHRRDNWS